MFKAMPRTRGNNGDAINLGMRPNPEIEIRRRRIKTRRTAQMSAQGGKRRTHARRHDVDVSGCTTASIVSVATFTPPPGAATGKP
jgi:hypothetical protein